MKLNNTRWFLILAISLISAVGVGQQQPPQAVNEQDEVIHIPLSAKQGPEDVLRVLRTNDKSETSRYIAQCFEIHNTKAYEILPYVNSAVATEKGIARDVITSPTDGSAPRNFLMVVTTREQMPSIAATIRAMDIPGAVNSQGSTRRAIRVRYRLASDLGNILKNTRLTSQAKIFADDLTNTLYFDDSEYVIKAAEDYVKFFDVPTPQIEFDIRIIEIREDDARKLGLDWDAWKRSLGGQFSFTGNNFEGGASFARLDSLLTLDASTLADFLNYATQQGNAKVVKRSRLTASNLNPAIISEARHIPFYDYVAHDKTTSVLTEANPLVDAAGKFNPDKPRTMGGTRPVTIVPPNGFTRTDLGQDEEGLMVSIQPVIGTESVQAKVDIEVNTFSGFDQQDRPLISNQELSNQFTLQNGETLLLGTLEREQVVESRRGIPGLKEIPGVRYLFSVEARQKTRSRVFLLATPKLSNVRFQAQTLADLKDSKPLDIKLTEPKLDDARVERLFGEAVEGESR